MDKLKEAKKYLSSMGYGSGTNYSTSLVAGLMETYADAKLKSMVSSSDVNNRRELLISFSKWLQSKKELPWSSGHVDSFLEGY